MEAEILNPEEFQADLNFRTEIGTVLLAMVVFYSVLGMAAYMVVTHKFPHFNI